MVVITASLSEIILIVVSAFIDALNPCAIGVMVLLVSLVLSDKRLRDKLPLYGGTYIASAFVVYVLAGLGLISILTRIPLWTVQYLLMIFGTLVILGGLIEIKDFFWYGRWFSLSISPGNSQRIKRYLNNISLWSMVFLGAFVAGVQLPCTSGPYLAIVLLLSKEFDATAFLLLLLYNAIFVLPLVLILAAAMIGVKVSDMHRLKQATRGHMRLAIGMLLIFLGWLLLFGANGLITLD